MREEYSTKKKSQYNIMRITPLPIHNITPHTHTTSHMPNTIKIKIYIHIYIYNIDSLFQTIYNGNTE